MFTITNNTGVYFTQAQKIIIRDRALECGINCVMLVQDTHEQNLFDVYENGNDYGLLFTFDTISNCIVPEFSEGFH